MATTGPLRAFRRRSGLGTDAASGAEHDASPVGSRRRILLLVVAGLLSASALLAIGILLVGHFGRTEGRILGTTALLAGYGLVSVPATVLLDQRRLVRLAVTGIVLAAAGASVALTAVWMNRPPGDLGRTVGTVTALALAAAQSCAMSARRRVRDPGPVRRLFGLSVGLAGVVAAMFSALLWARIGEGAYVRLLAALVVADLLVVALQVILARARPAPAVHRLLVVVEPDERVRVDVEAVDLAAAAAKAIRTVEEQGRRVLRLEVGQDPATPSEPPRPPAREKTERGSPRAAGSPLRR